MTQEKTYCEGLTCPIKETCGRYTERPESKHKVFTEIPGRQINTGQEGNSWFCDKQTKKE